MKDEITEVKVINDNGEWFTHAYNETYPLPDEQLEAETADEAIAEARRVWKWQGSIQVYNTITAGRPDYVVRAV